MIQPYLNTNTADTANTADIWDTRNIYGNIYMPTIKSRWKNCGEPNNIRWKKCAGGPDIRSKKCNRNSGYCNSGYNSLL